jgi:hypothetical protein
VLDDLMEEGHEFITGVASGGSAVHLSRFHIQGRIQRKSSMPVILKSMAFGTTWRHRQDRIETVQSLDG